MIQDTFMGCVSEVTSGGPGLPVCKHLGLARLHKRANPKCESALPFEPELFSFMPQGHSSLCRFAGLMTLITGSERMEWAGVIYLL